MRRILSLAIFLSFLSLQAIGQEENLLDEIEIQLQQGQKRALRDLGILLDDAEKRSYALYLLERYSFFEKEMLLIDSTLSKANFVNFYFDHFDQIHFSPLLSAFYINPVEDWNSDLFLKKENRSHLNKKDWWVELARLEKGEISFKQFLSEIITDTRTHPAPDQLLPIKQIIRNHLLELENPSPAIVALYGEWATWFADEEDFNLLLQWTSTNQLEAKLAYTLLARLTNHVFPQHFGKKEPMVQAYAHLKDTLGSLNRMITSGYSDYIDFSPNHFPNRNYFLGKIISNPDCPPWIFQNAWKELKASRDPILLFFLAGKLYQSRLDQGNGIYSRTEWFNSIQRLTQVDLLIDSNALRTIQYKDLQSLPTLRRFLIFWASEYQNFTWNPSTLYFEHNSIIEKDRSKYAAHFDQLSSVNDSIALDAWYKILQGPEGLVNQLIEVYRDKTPVINANLPPWRYGLLKISHQLALADPEGLQAFEENQILQGLLADLLNAPSDGVLFDLENQIISLMPPEALTGMEIWALCHSNRDDINLSCYHIIRHCYDQKLAFFWENEKRADLFFKKAKILASYQDYESNIFLQKTGLNSFLQLDANRFSSEVRQDFLHNKLGLQIQFEPEKVFQEVELLSQVEISSLPPIASIYLPDFFHSFLKIPPQDRDALKVYFTTHMTEESIPFLFTLLKEKIEIPWTLVCLENFYTWKASGSLKNQRKVWIQRWKEAKSDTEKLGCQIWKDKLERVQTLATIPENEIQWLVNSPYFQSDKKEAILRIISQQKMVRLLYRLHFEQQLKAEDLSFFEDLDFDLYALDNLPDHFEKEATSALFSFMQQQLSDYGTEEKVIFFSEQLLKANFKNFLLPDQKLILKELFISYLDQVSFITEAEEQKLNWLIFWLENGEKPVLDQLERVESMQNTPLIKHRLKEHILASVTWDEIPSVLLHGSKYLQQQIFPLPNFIQRDFGLPTGDLTDDTLRYTLANNLHALSKRDVYVKAFQKIGIQLEDTKGNPELRKIYTMLRLAPDFSFAGKGGIIRDYPYFGMIKYLETVFEQDFGLPEKLNDGTPFQKSSIQNRVNKWITFLETLLEQS
ncbi:MAG: hypothetical protein KDC24_07495 [Saprospiraceae bacterium]|nr:hypothetical protein [Saprospiraceae bacterium]